MSRSRGHKKRKGIAYCDCSTKSACFTTKKAADAAVARTPDAVRSYRGDCCGHYHVTRYTQDEYAQRIARFGVQSGTDYGIVDLEVQDEEAVDAWGESRGDEGGPRASSLERGTSAGLPPSPATVARRLAARRGS